MNIKCVKKLKILVSNLIPKVYNLPQVIYVNWLGYEWFIRK